MDRSIPAYPEIELVFQRTLQEAYEVTVRVTDPGSDAELAPFFASTHLAVNDFRTLRYSPLEYGQRLSAQVFQDTGLRGFYGRHKAIFEGRGAAIRLRVSIDSSAADLHGLRWELLVDPESQLPLATSERIMLSRSIVSHDWRIIKLRPKVQLKAVIAVAAPSDLAAFGLVPIDKAAEFMRGRTGLAGIESTIVGEHQPLTVGSLIAAVRPGTDILYLVCHGGMPKGETPCVFLEDERGNVGRVTADDLAQQLGDLQEPPRLIVMASCESAGREDGTLVDGASVAHAGLALRLGEAGIPAVIAMQGKISMDTLQRALPIFFRELLKDGQIDRALAAARGAVRDRIDSWMPALFLRLKTGRIWYEPGFAGDDSKGFEKWRSICHSIRKGQFIPILGPELGEDVIGGSRELANDLAAAHGYPLANHERNDLAKVLQFIGTNQDRAYAADIVQTQFLRQAIQHDGANFAEAPDRTPGAVMDLAAKRCAADPGNPYRILADLPAAIYLNASYESLLFRTLKAVHRRPEAIVTAWRGTDIPKQPQPINIVPVAETPWVYHLFGLFGKPNTLVLTEDDFFDFLIATSRLDLLLPTLVGRLMQSSLLFLGFRLDDWRFRILFRMIVTRPGTQTMKELSHVGVQLNPDEQTFEDVVRTRKYVESYFHGANNAPEISIYWGTPRDFLLQLQLQLGNAGREEPAPAAAGNDDWI